MQRDNPAHGDWCVDGREMNAWVNASSLVIEVVLERHETVLEDACWLRPENDAQHINLAELDAMLKGINLALQWQCKVLHVKTDCVHALLGIGHSDWENSSAYQFSHGTLKKSLWRSMS